MKKVIEYRVYDSDTAREVGRWNNSLLPTDANYVQVTLYRKQSGTYFFSTLCMRWNGKTGDMRTELTPTTAEEARVWTKEHLSTEIYDIEFGERKSDAAISVKSVSLSKRAIDKAKAKAAELGISFSALVEKLLLEL